MEKSNKCVLKGREKVAEELKQIAVLVGDDPEDVKELEDFFIIPAKSLEFLAVVIEENGRELSTKEALDIARKQAFKVVKK